MVQRKELVKLFGFCQSYLLLTCTVLISWVMEFWVNLVLGLKIVMPTVSCDLSAGGSVYLSLNDSMLTSRSVCPTCVFQWWEPWYSSLYFRMVLRPAHVQLYPLANLWPMQARYRPKGSGKASTLQYSAIDPPIQRSVWTLVRMWSTRIHRV